MPACRYLHVLGTVLLTFLLVGFLPSVAFASTKVNSPTPPAITTQPANQTVTAGQTASFTAAATGSPTPAVQWLVSTNSGATFSNISGATATTLSFTTALSQSGNQYRAVFTNRAGTATTTAATLTVNATPPSPSTSGIITLQNTNSNLCIDTGGSTSFTTLIQSPCSTSNTQKFNLTAAPVSGWYYLVSAASSLCWDVVGGSSSAGALIQQYTCVAVWPEYFQLKAVPGGYEILSGNMTNGCLGVVGASTASGANIAQNTCTGSKNQIFVLPSNNTPPTITTQPASQTVTASQTASFTAAASGSPTPTVQWQVSTNSGATFSNISGATSTTLSFTTALSQSGNQYHAVFTNSAGTAATTAATLTVNAVNQPPTVNAGAAQTITLPSSATLNGTAADDGLPAGSTLTTTWSKVSGLGTVTFGNANALSTTASFSAAGTYSLRLTASDTALSSTSDVTITVNPALAVVVFGYAVQGAAIGATMSNTVSATRYQMAGQNGTVTSMSAFIASPVSAPPNTQFQVAIYADNNGAPGAVVASSGSQAIVADAWHTVPISAPVAATAYYVLSYTTNVLAADSNNSRYD